MTASENLLYTGKVRTVGGRDGSSRSSDGRLDVHLSFPGGSGSGTNPEQLFAAGWSACFGGALAQAACDPKIGSRIDPVIDAEVDLNMVRGEFLLRARLRVSLPGLERDAAERLVESAHRICPYSKMTRDNIDVAITLV